MNLAILVLITRATNSLVGFLVIQASTWFMPSFQGAVAPRGAFVLILLFLAVAF
jgi:hypothetical protein